MAVVVLLPFVPVMHATRSGSSSAREARARSAPRCRAPSSCGHLGPVATDAGALDHDLAGHQCIEAPCSVASTSSPPSVGAPACRRPGPGLAHRLEAAETGSSLDSQAPQADRPDASASADQEIRGGIAIGDAMGTTWFRATRRRNRTAGMRHRGLPTALDQGSLGAVVASGGQTDRSTALARVADALERLGVRLEPEQ